MADNKLNLLVNFIGVDKLSAGMRNIVANARSASAGLKGLRAEQDRLKRTIGQTADLRSANAAWSANRKATMAARQELTRLKGQIVAGEPPSQKLVRSIQQAEKTIVKLEGAEKQAGARTKSLSSELKAAGVDVTRLGEHERKLAGQLDQTTRRIEAQKNAAARAAKLDKLGEGIGSFGQKLTVGATLPFGVFVGTAIQASREGAAAMAQVNAGLASMGPKAGRSLEQLKSRATGLANTSLFDDDEILRKVTANMLTFGNVSGTTFDRAQLAAVNLSARLGQDLQSSSIQLGKALNDPVKGVTALSKVGVSFTAQQKAMIKSMVAHGNVAGAQSLILKELEQQYGGSAKAARDADPGGALSKSYGEFQQAVGDRLLPKLTPLVIKLTELIDKFGQLSPAMQDGALAGGVFLAALGPTLSLGKNLTTTWQGAATAFSFAKTLATGKAALETPATLGAVGLRGKAIRAGGVVKGKAVSVGKAVAGKAVDAGTSLAGMGKSALVAGKNFAVAGARYTAMAARFAVSKIGVAIGVLGKVGNAALMMGKQFLRAGLMMLANPMVLLIMAIGLAIGVVAYLVYSNWDKIKLAFQQGWAWIKSTLAGAGEWMKSIGRAMMDGLLLMLDPVRLGNKLLAIAKSGITAFKNFFGIKSPSRLFMAMGGHMTTGLAQGIDRGGHQPLRSIGRLAAGVAGAGAGALSLSAPALAGPPLGRAAAAPGGVAMAGAITVQIYQQPGEDADALARRVIDLIERKRRGGGGGGSYGDDF